MKVLLINNCFYRRGGSEAVFFNTAHLLQEHGHEVVFMSYRDEKNEKTGCPEYLLNWGGALKKMKGYFYNKEAKRVLEEIIEKEHPDIAHAHLLWGGIGVSIFKTLKAHHIPLVHTAHDYRMVCPAYTFKDGKGATCERCQKWNFYQCALHKCNKGSLVQSAIMTAEMYYRQMWFNPIKNIDGFIFVSKFAEQKHIEHNETFAKANRTFLYNYTTPALSADITKKDDYILFFGRLSREKGIHTLIEACSQLPDVTLKVVGTGPLEDELKRVCDSRKLRNIEFLGYKKGTPLYELVRNARFVCVPSEWYENNPMTIVESYSLGTPVIGANIGGIPEIVEEGKTGYLFESRDAKMLEQQIAKATSITDEEYRKMSEAAYAFYQKNFSKTAHYDKLMAFYQSVIK